MRRGRLLIGTLPAKHEVTEDPGTFVREASRGDHAGEAKAQAQHLPATSLSMRFNPSETQTPRWQSSGNSGSSPGTVVRLRQDLQVFSAESGPISTQG